MYTDDDNNSTNQALFAIFQQASTLHVKLECVLAYESRSAYIS